MAVYDFTGYDDFKYRFQCEHCRQTTQWQNARLFETYSHKDYGNEDLEIRYRINAAFNEAFKERVPILRQEVEAGKYDAVFDRLDGCCPNCKKMQSWAKRPIGCWLYFTAVASGFLSVFMGYTIYISMSEGIQLQPMHLGIVVFLVFGVLFFFSSLYLIIDSIIRNSKRKLDSRNVTTRNKPEFSWSNMELNKS